MSLGRHGNGRGILKGAAILLCGFLYAQPGSLNAVTEVRFWSLGEATRIVVETTGEFEFRSERLQNPDRLFFDLLETTLRMEGRGERSVAVGDRLLKRIRVAETQSGVTRVVFDLAAEVDHSASQLSNPSRLIVELRPSAPGMPAVPGLPSSGEDGTIPGSTSVPAKPAREGAGPLDDKSAAAALKPPPEITPSKRELPIPKGTPTPARLSKDREQSLARVLGLKLGRVVLDAGHGGHDTGTIGNGGLMEKDLVLDVAKRLGVLIEKRMPSEVIYTRSDDTFIPLEARTQMANEHKADLFLSIHANASPARDSSGVETYYLNFTTAPDALEVAARENASSQKTLFELTDLLQKIALKDKIEESREFAACIQRSMFALSRSSSAKSKNRGVKKAPFVVLIGATMPSVLAEIGFMSNPRDERLMKRPEYRQKLAEALYKGLAEYAGTLSQFKVARN